MKRSPAVAGQFYPSDRTSLARTVVELCGPAIEEMLYPVRNLLSHDTERSKHQEPALSRRRRSISTANHSAIPPVRSSKLSNFFDVSKS